MYGADTGEAVIVRANCYAAHLISDIELSYEATLLLARGIIVQ